MSKHPPGAARIAALPQGWDQELEPLQAECVRDALMDRIFDVMGPPATGKSRLGAETLEFHHQYDTKGKTICCASTNVAVDEIFGESFRAFALNQSSSLKMSSSSTFVRDEKWYKDTKAYHATVIVVSEAANLTNFAGLPRRPLNMVPISTIEYQRLSIGKGTAVWVDREMNGKNMSSSLSQLDT